MEVTRMPIHNANLLIREARTKAGLTQEQLSEGICTPQALSRIETGTANVSHVTFQALMERAGAEYGRFPIFSSRDGFECLYGLNRVRLYLDAWQLRPAYDELDKLEEKNWAENRLYYQEWLLLHCRLQSLSGCCSHRENYSTLLDALHITRPTINLSDFHTLLLSQNEIQLLTLIAQEALFLDMAPLCRQICAQLDGFLADSTFALSAKERMQTDAAVVSVKYLIGREEFESAFELADSYRHKAALNAYDAPLVELTFLIGLCCHYSGKAELADMYIKAAFYSAQAIDSCYATRCRNYLEKETDYPITGSMKDFPTVVLTAFPPKSFMDSVPVTDGVHEGDNASAYTLGHLIQDLRLEQNISQSVLCYGLCSKSKLSKIENDILQPDVNLVVALLQRLGISGNFMPYWGNRKDAEFRNLCFQAAHNQNMPREEVSIYINKMEQLLDKDNILNYQQYLCSTSFKLDPYERIRILTEALSLTLPNFDIHQICSYRLTCLELAILNNIAHEYRCTKDSHLSSLYFQQILAYVNRIKPDILFQAMLLPFVYFMYGHSLCRLKFYQETIMLPDSCDFSIIKYYLAGYGIFLFSYTQALLECSCHEKAHTAAIQAYAINRLTAQYGNASLLKKYLYEVFSLDLNY